MKHKRPIRKNSGQMIILMGIILALAIFVMSGLSADIINLDIVISNERATSLVSEFDYIKETFGLSLNYNLINNITNETGEDKLVFHGDPNTMKTVFNQTRDEFYALELRYGNIFDAKLNHYWYSHQTDEKYVYYVNINLMLDDGDTYIDEDVLYSIVCQP